MGQTKKLTPQPFVSASFATASEDVAFATCKSSYFKSDKHLHRLVKILTLLCIPALAQNASNATTSTKPLPKSAPAAAAAQTTPNTTAAPASPLASDSLAPIPPEVEEPSFAYFLPEGKLAFYRRMAYEIEVGLSLPGNKALSGISKNFALSAHYFFGSSLDASFFFRKTLAKGIDNVEFDTSYTEDRKYSIGVNMLGFGARFRIAPDWSLQARSGLSFTGSTLTSISSTAPTGPVLEVGYQKPIPFGIPFDLQIAYELRNAKTLGAITASYSLSALGKDESLAEISLGLAIRFHGVPWEKIEETPQKP